MNKKKEELKMKLEIIVEKIVVQGEKKVRITKLEGKKWAELPLAYTRLKDSVHIKDGVLIGKKGWYKIEEWDILSPEELKELEEVCGVAASLLKRINKELGEKNRGWEGKTTFEF